MTRLLRLPALLTVLLAALLAASPAFAQVGVSAEIGKKATLLDNGRAVLVPVTVTCTSGSEALEAFVYVVQDGNTSQFGGIPVVCDDAPHTFAVRVAALDFLFHSGKARASAYVLVLSGTETASTSPGGVIKIR
jgi:hypothetical protein